jgi:hypothetical protein
MSMTMTLQMRTASTTKMITMQTMKMLNLHFVSELRKISTTEAELVLVVAEVA